MCDIRNYDVYHLVYIYDIERDTEIFPNFLKFLPSFFVKQDIKNEVESNFFWIRRFLL